MSKYPCGLIEDLIPLYIEGDVSEETREIVEQHLRECKDCSALRAEYSNDALKFGELKDDLPQADTFKRWMKRLKLWGLITAVIAIFAAIAIGIVGYKIGERPKNDLLTVKTIVKTLKKQGVPLKENNTKSSDDLALSGVKPAIFNIGDGKGTLLIYSFKSFVEREEVVIKSGKFNESFSLLEYPFNAKNALLVYLAPKTPTTEEEMKNIGETKTLISNIVFKDLNDGKVVVYRGQSASWEGTFTLKYYEHWWQDETGKIHYENYTSSSPVIKYKMADREVVGPIDFEYKTIDGGGRISGDELNKDGYLSAGISSNGTGLHEEDEVNFIVKWGGKEEDMVLKTN